MGKKQAPSHTIPYLPLHSKLIPTGNSTQAVSTGSTGFRLMTRDITHVHATKNSTELRKSVHVDPIVKFKVSKKTRLVN